MASSVARAALKAPTLAGTAAEAAVRHVGAVSLLVWRTVKATALGRVALREVLTQIHFIGVQSVPLVIVTAILSGIVTSQQGAYQFTGAIPLYVLGSVVTASVILELGPLMTAFVLIGRVGARITAEIGTMQVSEQIEALHSLGRDPVRILAAPRIWAGLLATPFLTAIADLTGVLAGMIAGNWTMGISFENFLFGAQYGWRDFDLVYSLMKGLAFGFVIPLLSSYMGFITSGGAEGVGRATTRAVVVMIVAVLVLDAIFPPLFLE